MVAPAVTARGLLADVGIVLIGRFCAAEPAPPNVKSAFGTSNHNHANF